MAVVAVAVIIVALPALAETPIPYRVRAAQGLVLVRGPNSPRWQAVKEGSRLVEGQIVQVTSGASVTIEGHVRQNGDGLHGDRVQLILTKPIVARLSPDLLRQVHLSTFFVDKVPSMGSVSEALPEVPLTLKDAWERLAAMISGIPPAESPGPQMAELERQGMALGISAKKLRILTPVTNSVIQASDWPAELKVVWVHPPSARSNYLIYVWPTGTSRGSARGETTQNFYTVQVQHPGTYFIQVATADGAWQSPGHVVYAIAPANSVPVSTAADTRLVEAIKIPSLNYPPERFMVASDARPAQVAFSWAMESPWPGVIYTLKFVNEATKDSQETRTNVQEALLTLLPGRYTWSVSVHGPNIHSAERHLEVFEPLVSKTSADRQRLVRELIDSGKSGTMALDGGL